MPWRWVLAVGVAIGVVKFSLLFVGMDVGMPAGLASLVLQVQAFFTLGFAAVLLRERLRGAQVAGLALASGGLALVASGLDGARDAGRLRARDRARRRRGASATSRSSAPRPPDPLRFMTWMCVVPPLPLFALSLAFEGPREVGDALAGIDLGGIAAVAYIAFAATTVGWGLWAYLMRALLGRRRSRRSRCSCRSSGSASRRCCSASRSTVANRGRRGARRLAACC